MSAVRVPGGNKAKVMALSDWKERWGFCKVQDVWAFENLIRMRLVTWNPLVCMSRVEYINLFKTISIFR
jgi:hypothetical protein